MGYLSGREVLVLGSTVIFFASLLAFPVSVTPTFASIAGDTSSLGTLETLVLTKWFPPLLALPSVTTTTLVWWRARRGVNDGRRLLLGIGLALAAVGIVVCLWGLGSLAFGLASTVEQG